MIYAIKLIFGYLIFQILKRFSFLAVEQKVREIPIVIGIFAVLLEMNLQIHGADNGCQKPTPGKSLFVK